MLIDVRPQTNPKKVPLVSGLSFLIVVLCLLNGVGVPCEAYFSLISANTIVSHVRIWNIMTSGLLETNFFSMVFSSSIFYVVGGHLETTWGKKHLGLYLFVVQGFAGLLTFMYHILFYICFENEGYLYKSMHGSWGLIVAVFMGIVQLFPDSSTPYLSHIKLRYLPFASVVLATFLRGFMIVELPFIYFSFFGSFLYLKRWRLGKHLVQNGMTANACPQIEFKFEDLFPPPSHIFARYVAEFAFTLQNTLCKSSRTGRGSYHGNQYLSVPATANQVAERRRAKALELLDKKLAQLGSAGTVDKKVIKSTPMEV